MALKRPIVDYYGNLKDMADGDYIRPSLLGSGTPSANSVLNGNGEWVSIASLNYWTLEAGNVYRATGKVFVGNQYDLGNYTFQVSGDTVTTGKINVGYVPNPSAQVEVYGGANFRYPSSDNNSLYVRMGSYISSGLYGTFLKSDSYYSSTLITNLHLGITDSSGTDKTLISLIGSTNFVGINTVTPTERLEVGGLNAKIFVNGSDNLSNISLGRDDYSWRIANETNFRIYGSSGRTSSANNLFFSITNTSGYVGIGTASPLSNVHVNYAGVANTFVLVGHNNGGTYFGHNADNRGVIAGYLNTDIIFGHSQSATFVETVRFTNTGKVLIGIGENGSKLFQVNGGIRQNDVISGLVYADSLGQFVSAEASHITTTLGDGYIKNQSSYDQVASFRINGTGIFAHSSPIRFDNAGNQDIHSNNGGTVRFINSAYNYANIEIHQSGRLVVRTSIGVNTYAETSALDLIYSNTTASLDYNSYAIANFRGSGHVQLAINSQVTGSYTGHGIVLQAKHSTSNGSAYDILINPLGGSIGIGTLQPAAFTKLHVSGVASGSIGVGYGSHRVLLISNTDTAYGMHLGVAGSGNSWIQSGRADSTTVYDLCLQHEGGKVIIGGINSSGSSSLQVQGDIYGSTLWGATALLKAVSGVITRAEATDLTGLVGDYYIKNQYNNAQSANAWISGDFRANGFVKAGRKGFYGSYDYTEVQGIWSIAEGYPIDTASNTFGNQYGIVYGYEYGTTGTSRRPLTGYSHQILFVGNGVVYSAISMDTGKAFFNGYVGVGLSDATYYLDVVASIRLRNQSQIYFDTPSGASSNYIGITNSYWTTIYAGRGTTARIDLTNANGILFSTNTYERFRVEVDGKVLINTSSAYNGSVLQVNGSILQRNVIATSIVKILAADSNGTIVEADQAAVMGVLGDGAYIKNQFANAQAGAYFWIEQYARVGGYSTTGSTPRFSVTGDHSTTNFSLYSIGNGAGNDSSLDMWASEPGLTYDGCGIGHNINNSPYYGRRNTSQGQSYIRFYAGHVFISAASSERTNPSASTWIFNSNGIFYWGGSGGDKAQLTWDSGYAAVQSINGNRLLLGVAGADSSLMTLTTSAKVLIGTTAENSYKVNINGGGATYDGLYVNGHIRATGNIIADGYFSGTSSDRRYKSEFRPITVIDKIDKIDVSSYQHKLYGRRMIGSIAQDIEQLFPELVYQDDNKMYRLYDNGYAAIALQLGKEVKSEVDKLKERVQELEKQIEYLSK